MRQHFWHSIILFMGMIWGWNPAPGFSQHTDADNLYVDPSFVSKQWTVRDGLPVNSVSEIIQSRQGYIWFSTFDGLVRFDGVRFKVYKTDEYDGMVSNRIIKLAEAPDSSIFIINTTRELVRFKNNRFEKITNQHGHNGANTHSFFREKDDGRLWIGTSKGLLVYENGRFRPYHPGVVRGHIVKFHIDSNGILWYRDNGNQNIYRFDGETRTLIAGNSGTGTDPMTLLTTDEGSTFISTLNHVYHFKNGKSERVPIDQSGEITITDLHKNIDGSVLMSTQFNGLFKLENGRFAAFNDYGWDEGSVPKFSSTRSIFLTNGKDEWLIGNQNIFYNGKPVFSFDNRIDFSLPDREGGLWLGTHSLGLFRLIPNPFVTYSIEEGMPSPNIYPVIETSDGAIWAGTFGSGVARLKNGEIQADFNYQTSSDELLTRSLIELDSGTLLASFTSEGIFSLNRTDNTFTRWDPPKNQPDLARPLTIESLFQDSKKRVWTGTTHGLYLKDSVQSEWRRMADRDSNPDHPVRSIAEAPDGTLWMATYGDGVLQYQSGAFESFTTEAGLSSNFVRYIHVDTTFSTDESDYVLWIGTGDKGLNRVEVRRQQPDLKNITIYNEQVGLYDNVVHVILPDDSGRFWMSGNRGISWVKRSDLEQFANGRIPSIKSVFYTEEDGLRNREANGGIQSPGIKTGDGFLWFPTQDGIVRIDPDHIGTSSPPTPVIIEQAISDNEPIAPKNEQFFLEPGQRDFNITYTGLNFTSSDKIRFKYRLRGFHEDWTEAEFQRTAFFTNIPAGTYQFELLATNNLGEWNTEPAAASVTILPWFYETNWFKLLIFSAVAFSLFLLVHYRIHHLKRKKEELEQSIKERTAELESEKRKTEAQARELQKLDRYKSQFFTNITHEFRTPLTLIIGPLQKLVQKKGEMPPERIETEIKRALGNSRRLQRLIDQILDLSRLEAGELTLKVQQVDLVEFSRKVTDMFTPLADHQDLTIECKALSGHIFIYADPDALEKILANLLSNAIKFTPAGGAITILIEEKQAQAMIRISDTGIGIRPDELKHVFDRFYQTDSSSTRIAEGSGIGLALVKHLVELHEGEILAESVSGSGSGSGSTFTVHFKKGKKHFDESEILQPADSEPAYIYKPALEEFDGVVNPDGQFIHNGPDLDPNKPNVLIVEDNTDMRNFIRSTLDEHFSILEAADGEAALRLLKEKLPDLIISDIMMPNMDGVTLNEELKKDPMLEAIPVIFLTAKAGQENILEGLRNGADDYLTKPFEANILVARTQNIIKKRQLLRRHILQYGVDLNDDENGTDTFLGGVNTVLHKKFADPDFGVSDLAEALHLDRTRLFRKLKDVSGCSPQEFLHEFRMKQAAKLLLERSESISEVAYACGFNNMAYFSRSFKKTYSLTPSEFLARHVSGE